MVAAFIANFWFRKCQRGYIGMFEFNLPKHKGHELTVKCMYIYRDIYIYRQAISPWRIESTCRRRTCHKRLGETYVSRYWRNRPVAWGRYRQRPVAHVERTPSLNLGVVPRTMMNLILFELWAGACSLKNIFQMAKSCDPLRSIFVQTGPGARHLELG